MKNFLKKLKKKNLTKKKFFFWIFRLIEECGIVMYCDLHAHSRKHNVFIYGCENKRYIEKRLHEQVFPLMLHKNAADKVNVFY